MKKLFALVAACGLGLSALGCTGGETPAPVTPAPVTPADAGTPPADGTTTPPADGTTTPPADGTATPAPVEPAKAP